MEKTIKAFDRYKRVVASWATSLQSEGYQQTFGYACFSLIFYKLKHSYNGNEIVIKGYPRDNFYFMLKNGKRIKSGKIIENNGEKVH